ncbi:hypothetical protein KBB96_11855 [Luteolibacter ambystomatis]|uniref:Uncharacterized protein n=1 Tax=Luteolibacter ambystomatis TaxID=2824561 RepID=A0A975G6A1_9BACT|nr:hypothetical protein [Luteolibacter ambystomatis]QUE49568.1 hypothetical protein KBB96_11855 [Luteolibacter ambystomatis]
MPPLLAIGVLAGAGVLARKKAMDRESPGENPAGIVSPSRSPHAPDDAEPVDPNAYFPEPPEDKKWSPPLKSALQGIFRERNEAARSKLLQQTAEAIPPTDFPDVLSYLREFDREDVASNLTADLANRLMERWAAADLKGLSDWAAKSPPGTLRDDAISCVIQETASKDAAAAEAWARTLPDPETRTSALRDLAQHQTIEHPETALRLLKDLPSDPDDLETNAQISLAASNWAHDHPEDATRWVGQLEDSPMKTEALAGIAISMAEKNPAEAAAFAVDKMPACQRQSDTVVGVVQLWAQQDPLKAADWVADFPAGAMKDSASRTLVAIWSQTAPDKAGAWLKQQVAK